MPLDKSELVIIYDSMSKFADEMRHENDIGIRIAKKTSLFINLVVILFFISSSAILYKTSYLTDSMIHLAGDMVQMYNHFGEMSDDVSLMSVSVRNMDNSINGMPAISDNMLTMGKSISLMQTHVSSMENNVSAMENKMSTISFHVNDMSKRFVWLNNSVWHMQYNTRQMSKPMRNMNTVFPFVR